MQKLREDYMRSSFVFLNAFILAATVFAYGGDITGRISGVSGTSVVWVEAPAGKAFPAPEKHFLMDQKGLAFQPHILMVPVGATVDFRNSDSVGHNVFWPSISGDKKLSHNLGTWPQGETRSFKFSHPGIVPLLCNVHPEMSGYIIVTPTPYAAETDASGNFEIKDVPDGNYKVMAWGEGAKTQSKPVSVSGKTNVDFALGK
jgi:plastocyanin